LHLPWMIWVTQLCGARIWRPRSVGTAVSVTRLIQIGALQHRHADTPTATLQSVDGEQSLVALVPLAESGDSMAGGESGLPQLG
jgi:hypothetical protein